MAYAPGEKGEYIESLIEQASDEFDNDNYETSLMLLEKAWDELPGNKNEYDESFLIVWGVLNTSILIKDHNRLKKWIVRIFNADPERADIGEREMWAGRVAYELGELAAAKKYFEIADKKSEGRCFNLESDEKYFKFHKDS